LRQPWQLEPKRAYLMNRIYRANRDSLDSCVWAVNLPALRTLSELGRTRLRNKVLALKPVLLATQNLSCYASVFTVVGSVAPTRNFWGAEGLRGNEAK
jgi:hypothetical protein